MPTLVFGKIELEYTAQTVHPAQGGYILEAASCAIQAPPTPRYYYRHGWQSWSLAAWHAPTQEIPLQKPISLHPMQIDPVYAYNPNPNSSWVGAVEMDDDNILLLGALGLEAHVALRGGALQGWYESVSKDKSSKHEWFVGYGKENEVFASYAELLGERLGRGSAEKAPRVWCSWYSLYNAIDENILLDTLEKLGDLPFDIFQLDDGWQISVGDWQANDKFPSGMAALAEKIKATGRRAGLWLAPLLATPSSSIYRDHKDWLLKDEDGKLASAGFNFGEQLYALDTTHPEALNFLAETMKQVRAWGYDYLKLDFLYAGSLSGKRHVDMPREAAYRHGLSVIREAMGADAYFLACGSPIIPSLGLCDAMRIGPDVANYWDKDRDSRLLYNQTTPGVQNGIRTSLNRLWLKPLVHTDPDVAYFRSVECSIDPDQKSLLRDMTQVCQFKATSDLPHWWTDSEREQVRTWLTSEPQIERTGRATFTLDGRAVDFSPALPLPAPPAGFDALRREISAWGGDQGWIMSRMFQAWKRDLEKMKQEKIPK
ncbi:MAG: alpha-galactosidase [Anaerolineae bacterium]|nr:alpha-galactosidase [Anaerolineae bacterium]